MYYIVEFIDKIIRTYQPLIIWYYPLFTCFLYIISIFLLNFNRFCHNYPAFPHWHQIGAQITQTGTALRFTGKNAHVIMVMLKVVRTTIQPSLFQASASRRCHFYTADAMRPPYGRKGRHPPWDCRLFPSQLLQEVNH